MTFSLVGCILTDDIVTYNDSFVESLNKDMNAYDVFSTEISNAETDEAVNLAYNNYLTTLNEINTTIEELGCFEDDCSMYDTTSAYIAYIIEVISTQGTFDEDQYMNLYENILSAQKAFATKFDYKLI